jgi:DNA-directed RNA polymerase subunit H (RpoH/RPB5)
MNNSNQQLFVIYQNVSEFYKYRGLVSLDAPLPQADFAKKIQKDKYILLSAVAASHADNVPAISSYIENFNEKSSKPDVAVFHILIIYPGTECESKRANMMKFVNHVRYPKADVLIITASKISSSVLKGLAGLAHSKEHRRHTFSAYTYDLLTTIVPEYELAPKYEILGADHGLDAGALPKIFENDPQMVWIGATVGQVIKYTCLSEITIYAVGYCTVIAAAG